MLFDDMRSPDLTPEALLLGAAPLGNALAPPTVPLWKNSRTIDLRWRHFCIHEPPGVRRASGSRNHAAASGQLATRAGVLPAWLQGRQGRSGSQLVVTSASRLGFAGSCKHRMRGFGEYEVPAQRERDTCVDVNAVLRSNAANAAAGVPEEKSNDAQTVRCVTPAR